MPHFRMTTIPAGPELRVIRALCDGCDPARPCEEHSQGSALWIVTAGAFVMRDAHGKHTVDPTHALLMQPGHAFTISHPAGPDTCIAFRGPLVDRLAAEAAGRGPAISDRSAGAISERPGPVLVPYTPARLASLVGELQRGEPLALAEALVALASPEVAPVRTPSRSDRALAEAIIHALRVSYADHVSLADLADRTGYSVFHACRVFRAVTGTTIHGYRRELRLRHALARILDGDESLASVAASTGFASQSHLTNQYRARFGITPARTRTPDGLRRLAA